MKVKPMKMIKTRLVDVADGDAFVHSGIRYIKLTSDRGHGRGVFATTLYPSCTLPTNCNFASGKSLEERIVEAFIENVCFTTHGDIITYGIADADDYRIYADLLRRHIKDCWYVDMGVEDELKDGEYFYIDEFGRLERGNEYDEKEDGVTRTIGLRAVYWFEPNTVVHIEVQESGGSVQEKTAECATCALLRKLKDDGEYYATLRTNRKIECVSICKSAIVVEDYFKIDDELEYGGRMSCNTRPMNFCPECGRKLKEDELKW